MAELKKTAQEAMNNNIQHNQEKSNTSILEAATIKILCIIIIVLLLSLPIIGIKFNVAGMGETVRPFLENIKYAEKILPPKPDPNDPKYMSKQELMEKYTMAKEDNSKLLNEMDALKQELDFLKEIKENYEDYMKQKEQLNQEYEQLKQQENQLQVDKEQFYQDIANQKKTDFKEYFEKINKEKAEQLYAEIIREQEAGEQVKKYVTYYEKMEPDSAASILEEMSRNEMELVVNILKNMKAQRASEILAEMTPSAAASISRRLSKEFIQGD